MTLRGSLQVAVVSATLGTPLAAFAATVTTAPIPRPVPALALPLLVGLALALIGLGAYRIGTRSAGKVAGVAMVAALGVLAGLSYATLIGDAVIRFDACNVQTVTPYNPEGAKLISECPNPIKIVAIDPCGGMASMDVSCSPMALPCMVNQILTNGQFCQLPSCCN